LFIAMVKKTAKTHLLRGYGRLDTFVRMKGLEPPRHEDTRS
jgi:hypothetical protein